MTLITGHFARIHAGTWTGPDFLLSDAITFDQESSQILNGDDGGTWAPVEVIQFSGTTFGLNLTGPAVVWGLSGVLQTSTSSRFTCNVGDFPQLSATHVGRTRQIKSSFATARCAPWQQWIPHVGANGTLDGMMQTMAYTTLVEGAAQAFATTIWAPLEVHNGGTLESVTISFAVSSPHASVPTMAKARVLRCNTVGGVIQLTSVAAGADANGYVSMPTPASAVAYYNNGAVQSWTIPCDQFNVVSTAGDYYMVEIVEEQSSGAQTTTILAPVDLVTNSQIMTTFTGLGGLVVDGVTLAPGMRLLLKDQLDPTQNGIWQVGPYLQGSGSVVGNWFRPADFALGNICPVGTQVPSKSTGVGLANTTFVMSAAVSQVVISGGFPQWLPNTAYTAGQAVVPLAANGFVYTCSTAGTSSSSTEPVWPTVVGAKTATDGSVVWTCSGTVTSSSSAQYWSPLGAPGATSPPIWLASHAYLGGQVVSPSTPNGFVFRASVGSGTSGATEPTWPTVPGGAVADGSTAWIAMVSTYNSFVQPVPQGNIWNDLVANMANITSLAFQ
jgi:hypothetical protein